jgi:Fe-S cluster biosynthesis and repair protein YggX
MDVIIMNNTLFQEIYEKFYELLVGDTKFFNYNNLSIVDVEEIVKDRSFRLMLKSINYINSFGVPQIDLLDFNKELKEFNNFVTEKETDLIAENMYYFYSRESFNKIQTLGLTFNSKELNVFSPANDRNSMKELVKYLQSEVDYKIESYLNRDRLTGKLKIKNLG